MYHACYCCQQDQVRWSMFSLKNVSKIVSKIEAITGGGCPCELPTLQSIVQSSILNWLGIFCDTPLKEEVQPALKLAWVMYECMCVATACILAHYTSVTVTKYLRICIIFVTYNLTPKSISIYCYIIHALSIVHSSSSLTSLQVLLAESSGSPRCAVPSLPSEPLSAAALFSIEGLLSRLKAKIMFWEFLKANWVGLKTIDSQKGWVEN